MNLSAIRHRSTGSDCYALDENTVVLQLWTAHDADAVTVFSEDPFIQAIDHRHAWKAVPAKMEVLYALEHHLVWSIELTPAFKRLQYYFVVESGDERVCVFENKVCPEAERDRISTEYFKFPWLNPSDVIAPPAWVRDTVWYQIMPDRFARSRHFADNGKFRAWGDFSSPGFNDLYGGSLQGITERLPYLRELGIGGIYLTPIFLSNSYHKYNTFDYYTIDPDFGTEADLKALVQTAHGMGIRVMLDAVFNHCGTEFFAWKDVCEKGRRSPYFDWFFINRDDFIKPDDFTVGDGRYFAFSFWTGMPKLNTNTPEVRRYFTDLCVHWVRSYDIDGIRFDVADEVSHTFLRQMNAAVKAVKPDIFLLGEIWFDAIGWLNGYEFDSVMNYPFTGCLSDFWRDGTLTAQDFMQRLHFSRSLYPRQINEVVFNFLDTHDTARARENCRSQNELLQKLAVLLCMAGTPCLYYGTEIAMRGKRTPYNRSTMPWDDIDAGKFSRFQSKVRALIAVRHACPDLRRDKMALRYDENHPRLVRVQKGDILLTVNATGADVPVTHGEILFQNGLRGGVLGKDGVLIEQVLS